MVELAYPVPCICQPLCFGYTQIVTSMRVTPSNPASRHRQSLDMNTNEIRSLTGSPYLKDVCRAMSSPPCGVVVDIGVTEAVESAQIVFRTRMRRIWEAMIVQGS